MPLSRHFEGGVDLNTVNDQCTVALFNGIMDDLCNAIWSNMGWIVKFTLQNIETDY